MHDLAKAAVPGPRKKKQELDERCHPVVLSGEVSRLRSRNLADQKYTHCIEAGELQLPVHYID